MLLDTSGLFCFLSANEPAHPTATRLLKSAPSRIVHSAVLMELVPLAESRHFSRSAVIGFLSFIIDNPDFTVIWLDQADHRQSLALLKARPDKHYSLCDAASFVIMRRMNIREALTTDHHFEQEGFTRLLK